MPSKSIKGYFDTLNQPVPQTKQADPAQVRNATGGFVFEVSLKSRLERFLILGTDGGTYYVKEQEHTKQNIDWLINAIQTSADGGLEILKTVVEVSKSGRAYRNSQALLVLSLLFKHGIVATKHALREEFNKVVRTSTHLFEFAQNNEQLGGWSRAKRTAVAQWYLSKSPDELAYQAVKYRQRDGWTHRDLFRLSHPDGIGPNLGNFILGKEFDHAHAPAILAGFKLAQQAKTIKELIEVLTTFPNLPWEAVPTQFHKSPELWKKLFENGQLQGQALLRQITRLARLGLFKDMVFAREYANRLVDETMIAQTRLHPMQYLLALVGHIEGQVQRDKVHGYTLGRNKDWETSQILADALDDGFYKAFKHIEPANKRTMIGLDVSSSMENLALGIDLSCSQVAAAMAMVTARTEPYYQIYGFSNTFRDLGITSTTSLPEVLRITQHMTFGRTDCSLPMEKALQENLEVDTFLVITDNETYAGRRHPHVALQDYRKRSGIDAKLVVMGMTSTGFSIAKPDDRGMLDVVGADANTPRVVADFSAGRI